MLYVFFEMDNVNVLLWLLFMYDVLFFNCDERNGLFKLF